LKSADRVTPLPHTRSQQRGPWRTWSSARQVASWHHSIFGHNLIGHCAPRSGAKPVANAKAASAFAVSRSPRRARPTFLEGAMKNKLRLDLEQLAVESFSVAAEGGEGTVHAHGPVPPDEPASDYDGVCGTNYASCGPCASNVTYCYASCGNTCVASCASCVFTCQVSCHSVCYEPA
jgi:hypothetical protein